MLKQSINYQHCHSILQSQVHTTSSGEKYNSPVHWLLYNYKPEVFYQQQPARKQALFRQPIPLSGDNCTTLQMQGTNISTISLLGQKLPSSPAEETTPLPETVKCYSSNSKSRYQIQEIKYVSCYFLCPPIWQRLFITLALLWPTWKFTILIPLKKWDRLHFKV